MKKIINGKKYNTETATELAGHSNNLSNRDFNYFYEVLYKKKTGEFFLWGEGGPMSKYAERYGDGWGSGERITPLTEAQARKWVERTQSGDTYEEIFGEVEE